MIAITHNPIAVSVESDASATSKTGGNLAPKRAGGPKILSAAARHEHAFIGQLLLEVIGPRFSMEVYPRFVFLTVASAVAGQVSSSANDDPNRNLTRSHELSLVTTHQVIVTLRQPRYLLSAYDAVTKKY